MIVTATHPLRSFSFELPEDAPEPAFSRTLLLPLVAHPVGEWLTVAATLLNSPDNALDAAREALANLRERVGCLVDDCRAQMAGMETAKESTQIDLMARIAAARAYLLTHAGRTVDLTELARVACMSPFHLNRRFRQAFGVSPAAYHRAARMALAKERLAGGMAPGAVGAGLGFASPASFSRAFAQYYGVPPGRHE